MADWVDVAGVNEIPPGGSKVVYVEDAKIALFNLGGSFHAIEDVCTHDGEELASGKIEGEEIVCPRHGARFRIKTGEVTAPPAYEPVYAFPLRVQDGRIQIRDDRWE
ncbi:MAG: ferredoxin [Candidatus Muproteobacteria bacterium RBG_16_65_34]|uniref:Ferredoxin n=1 Tax=Candidatus Muproteobacteria bacterium RBG_16_65_34 TaxID=1817760 RepID=A0A1F6TL54_9PROT|nr:MAG: ferredoxin [Candidatus Muproteobacteria bacterium RBG_16_65_34]